jgi:uncharacterized protein YndB with AHSA1/START domain
MTVVSYEVTIAAPATTVYRLLTTVDGLLRWIAASAVVEPEPGGVLRWTHENGATMSGRFVELDPPRRLVFTYGWEGDLMGLPPGASTVEIELEEREDETLLRLRHEAIPPDVVEDHRRGWIHFLRRLRDASSGDSDQDAAP